MSRRSAWSALFASVGKYDETRCPLQIHFFRAAVVSYRECAHSIPSSAVRYRLRCLRSGFAAPLALAATSDTPNFTLEQVLSYPYVSGLVASEKGDRFAWVENVRGVRNIWFALATESKPHQLTHYTADDGQELTQLTFSADGSELLYVRGGDHDANWPAQGNLAPNPDNSPSEAKVAIWSVPVTDSTNTPVQVAEGDSPVLSSKGQLAYVKEGQIWTAPLARRGSTGGKAQRLLFDRGKDRTPVWSPDGTRLAFVSGRGDHSFLGVYTSAEQALLYLAPSTSLIRSRSGLPTAVRWPSCDSPATGMKPIIFWCSSRTHSRSGSPTWLRQSAAGFGARRTRWPARCPT